MLTDVVAATTKAFVSVAVLLRASVAVAVTECGPSASGAATGTDQIPFAGTCTVPTTAPSTVTVTMAPGSPVPVYVTTPLVSTAPSAGVVTLTNVPVSTLKAFVSIAVLPLVSVAVAVTECGPSASGVTTGNDQIPFAGTVTVPTCVPSTTTTTVAPASAVPEYVTTGFVSTAPSAGVVTLTDVAVSTVKAFVSVAVLPLVSVAVAVTECGPSASVAATATDQIPFAGTVTVPTVTPSTTTTTEAPGSAVPE